jgi:hypothetical protein
MALNGISTQNTKQLKQEQKLEIAEAKRQGRTVTASGGSYSISGAEDPTANFYRTLNDVDLDALPTKYVGNVATPNQLNEGLQEGRPWVVAVSYAAELYRYQYTGYHGDVPTWFDSQTATASNTDSTPINLGAVAENTSFQWLGYFKPTTTETYTFFTTSDDGSYVWVGANAISGYTTANSIVNNGGTHASQERSGTIALTAGVYYPIRIQTGNGGGPGSFAFNYSTPTITKTSNVSGLMFHDDDTLGI